MSVEKIGSKSTIERLGIAASTVCAIHCAVTPFLSLLPLIGLGVLADERVEWILLGASLVLGSLSLIPGYLRHHRRIKPIAFFAAGFAFVITAHLLFEDNLRISTPAALIGAGLILTAYWLNRGLCRTCHTCCVPGSTMD